jgi:transposase
LHTLGIARPGRWWEMTRYQQLLGLIANRWGQQVRDQIAAELDRYLEAIEWTSKKLEELTELLRQSSSDKNEPRIKGIGPLTSELLDREIGDWNRFANRRQVASYTGLCPGEDSSGDSRMSLSIDKHGNPRVRAVLVEAAWLLPRFQRNYKRLARWKWVFDPASKATRSLRKKAAVALGRQLAVDLWRIKTGRTTPKELGLQLIE